MANGIAGLRPFPTFGGDKAGGITPVTLAPTAPRFPVARPINIAPAREDIDPLSYLAPVGLNFLANKLFTSKPKTPEVLSQEEQDKLSDFELANYLTNRIYGAPTTQTGGQRFGQLATQYLPALFTDNDKELAAFIQTTTNLDKARTDRTNITDTARKNYQANLLKDMTPKNMTFVDLVEFNKTGSLENSVKKGFLQGRPDLGRYGYTVNIGDGYFSTESDTAQNYAGNGKSNFVPLEFIDKATSIPRSSKANEMSLDEFYKAQTQREDSTLDVYNTVGEIIPILKKQATEETTGGIGAGGAMTSFINKGFNNATSTINAVATLGGLDSPFSTDEEGGLFKKGTGKNAAAIHEILKRGTQGENIEDELNAAMGLFQDETGFKFQREQGDKYTIQYNANMLKLAYTAAAAAGQTGRTLSDKDLAFFLEMVGYGKATSPTGQIAYLTNFVKNITTTVENTIDSTFGVGGRAIKTVYGSSLNSPKVQGIIKNYYNTALNGESILFDQNTPVNQYVNIEFTKVPFLDRYGAKDINGAFVQPSIRKFFEALDNAGVGLDDNAVLEIPGLSGMENLFN